jgi:hypothetical protein
MKDWIVCCVAIIMIGIMQMYWASLGHNGIYLSLSLTMIAGIAGYKVKDRFAPVISNVMNTTKKLFKKG